MHSTTLRPIVVQAFANESHKTRSFDNIDQDKMTALESKIRAIKGVDLYDHVKIVEMCLVLKLAMSKKFHVPEFIKTQCPITYIKSCCNK